MGTVEAEPDLRFGAAAPAMIGRVFLIRPGRTALNVGGRLRGHLDPPLDDLGQHQAAALAAALWDWRIVKILSSPLLRALQTASAVAGVAGVTVTVVDDLIDRDYGHWAGVSQSGVVEEFGAVDAAPGVEPFATVAERSLALLEAQLPALERGHVALVSHEAVIGAVLARLNPDLGPSLTQEPGSWTEIRRTQDRWDIGLTNQQPLLSNRQRY
jgi:probable phosphoglycerate mutase